MSGGNEERFGLDAGEPRGAIAVVCGSVVCGGSTCAMLSLESVDCEFLGSDYGVSSTRK
jgi:hypothetical protein